ILENNGPGGDPDIVSHGHVTLDLSAGPDHHAITQGGMTFGPPGLLPFPGFRPGPQGDALVEEAVVPDDGGLANHDSHAVIDYESPPDAGPGMDLDAGETAPKMRDEARQGHLTGLP